MILFSLINSILSSTHEDSMKFHKSQHPSCVATLTIPRSRYLSKMLKRGEILNCAILSAFEAIKVPLKISILGEGHLQIKFEEAQNISLITSTEQLFVSIISAAIFSSLVLVKRDIYDLIIIQEAKKIYYS